MKSRHSLFKKVITLIVLLTIIQLVWVAQDAVAKDELELRFRSIDTKKFPLVVLDVFVLGEGLSGKTLAADNFVVEEGGSPAKLVRVEPTGGKPMTVVLAIDTSGSMQGDPLNNAKAAAKEFVRNMKEPHRIAIVSFSTSPVLVAGLTSDKSVLNGAIDSLGSSGDTALYDGLNLCLEISAEAPDAQRNIIILSDGSDNISKVGFDQVLNRAKNDQVTVFGVGLQSGEFNADVLKKIADDTSGKLVLTSDSAALADLYKMLAKELSSQYTVSYMSKVEPADKDIPINLRVLIGQINTENNTSVANPTYNKTAVPKKGSNVPGFIRNAPLAAASSPLWLLLMLGLLFLSIFLTAVIGGSLFTTNRSFLKKQMNFYDKVAKKESRGMAKDSTGSEDKMDERRLLEEAIKMTKLVADKRGFIDTIQLLLIQAQLPLKPAEFILFHFGGVVIVGLISILFVKNFITTLFLIFSGVCIPLLYIYYRIDKRKKAFHEQLPDMLMLVASSLRAGYGLLQSLRMVADEMDPPISSELKKVLVEVNLGLSLKEALDGMALRIGSENLTWVVTAIRIQEEVGGNLVELFNNIGETIRERDQVSRQISVLTAEGKISAIILFVLPILLGIVFFVINRTYISLLYSSLPGIIMIIVASILMVIGGIWFRKIVSIEV